MNGDVARALREGQDIIYLHILRRHPSLLPDRNLVRRTGRVVSHWPCLSRCLILAIFSKSIWGAIENRLGITLLPIGYSLVQE